MDKIKLNCKDIKLLSLLDINSRASLFNLSKELGISNQAISKKIRQLYDSNYFSFVTFIDLFSVGYNNIHLYLRLQGYEKKDYEKFISELTKINGVMWAAELFGDFDLGISFFYKHQVDLAEFIKKINSLGKNKIKEKELLFIKSHSLSNFILDKERHKTVNRVEITQEVHSLSRQELAVLNKIKSNSRYSIYNLSEELNLNPKTVRSYLRHLESLRIIRWYKIAPNYEKLGRLYNICLLTLEPGTHVAPLLRFLEKEKSVPFISCTFEDNIIFDYVSKDYQEFKEYVNLLKNKFEDRVSNYKVFSIDRVIKNSEVY